MQTESELLHMASMSIIFLLLSFLCSSNGAQQQIRPGSSLSPSSHLISWLSPSGHFAFGFYQQAYGYAVGIWLVGKQNNTVVWTANRNDPPVSANSELAFTRDGRLLLRTELRGEKLITSNTVAACFASMHDSGNFVLYNKDHDIIWESFKYPTDTILAGQNLSTGGQLISRASESNYSTGKFHLKMQDNANLVLYPLNSGDNPVDAYWSSRSQVAHPGKFHLFLDSTSGLLEIINSSSWTVMMLITGTVESSGNSDNISNNRTMFFRATLDVDGVFRLYSHRYDGGGELKSQTEWEALTNPCEVKGFCGFNSFCTVNDNGPYCLCLPGSDFVDPNQWSLGCRRNYSEAECKGGKENAFHFHITRMENMLWGDRPYVEAPMSLEECSNSCLEDCNCGAALFQDNTCKKQKLPVSYVKRYPSVNNSKWNTAFLKVGIESIEGKNKSIPIPLTPQPVVVVKSRKVIIEIFIMTFGLIIFSCVALVISGIFAYKLRIFRYKRLLENGDDVVTEGLTLQLFTYNELKRATNNFKEELGKGSFGAVYKGALYKGKKLIAVKRLEKLVEEGEREFCAEMRAIGRTHHRNLVRLLGYCAVGSKRLLVYEYMGNGSLANLIFKSKRRPDWNERARIALDVAKGILYLHEECEATIIHCDIKPQNILMDDFWTAKIADFGLAKLLMPDQTRTLTIVRGTRGYLAPEWHKNTPISVKADIYSYGIVLLEIICCRRNMEINAPKPEEIILSTWAYQCFVARELDKLVVGEEVDKKALDKMVMVALWCIQDEPAFRPSMKSVVLMLEGITEILIPPCPTSASM